MHCVHLRPGDLNFNQAHAVIASQVWDTIYIEVAEEINESKLRYLRTKAKEIHSRIPGNPSRHQMVLLTELYPELNGTIRKAFLKGDDLHGVLPFVWEQGCPPGRDTVQVPPGN